MNGKNLSSKNTRFLRDIKHAMPKHCSNCGNKYKGDDLSIVQRDSYNAILHLTCGFCKESYLINVISPMGGLQGSSRMQLKIDIISAKEAKKFIGTKSVSTDDILAAHKELEDLQSASDLINLLKPTPTK